MPFRSDNAKYAGRILGECLAMYDDFDGMSFVGRAIDGVLSKESRAIGAINYSVDIAPTSLKPYTRLNPSVPKRREPPARAGDDP